MRLFRGVGYYLTGFILSIIMLVLFLTWGVYELGKTGIDEWKKHKGTLDRAQQWRDQQ